MSLQAIAAVKTEGRCTGVLVFGAQLECCACYRPASGCFSDSADLGSFAHSGTFVEVIGLSTWGISVRMASLKLSSCASHELMYVPCSVRVR